jgi:hypothetical protein
VAHYVHGAGRRTARTTRHGLLVWSAEAIGLLLALFVVIAGLSAAVAVAIVAGPVVVALVVLALISVVVVRLLR